MDKNTLGLISAIINVTTLIPFALAVAKGTARPNRVTWGIWTFLSWVILLASIASGARATLFWLYAAVFNCTFIFGLSLWRGVWEKSKLEIWCLLLGILGVVLWYVTQKAYYSVYISVCVDAIAIIPTLRKVWRFPDSEPKIAWSVGFISALLNAAAIDVWRPVIFIPPLTVVFWHLPILMPIYLKNKRV